MQSQLLMIFYNRWRVATFEQGTFRPSPSSVSVLSPPYRVSFTCCFYHCYGMKWLHTFCYKHEILRLRYVWEIVLSYSTGTAIYIIPNEGFFFQIYRQQCAVDKHMVQWSFATLFERDFPLQKNPWCNSCLTFIIYIFIFNTSVSLAICPPLYLLMPLAVQVLALPLPRVPIQFEYQMLCLISPLYYCPRKTASDWCRQQTVHRFGVKIPTVASVQSTGEDACN